MFAKKMSRLIIVAVLSFSLGWIVRSFLIHHASYARVGTIATQGRELISSIHEVRQRTGNYPYQEWFASRGSARFTIENRLWCYHVPAINSKGSNGILLTVPIDQENMYAIGYDDGTISVRGIEEALSSAGDNAQKR